MNYMIFMYLFLSACQTFSWQRMLIAIRFKEKGENKVLKHLLENKPKVGVENLMTE